MKISNRTFLISGGSSGLGLATVRDLVKAGAYVSIVDRAPPPAELQCGPKSRVLYTKMDITVVEEVERAVEQTIAWTKETGALLGGIINGAGIGKAELLVNLAGEPHSTKLWEELIAVNLTGTFHLTRLGAKHLIKVPREEGPDGERGVVILISSSAAYEGQIGQIAYSASKGALISMTLPLARDLARHGVRVINIAPGPFTTPLTGQFSAKMTEKLHREAMLYPKRYGIPAEFAATVKWVLECPYINAETIKLNGGARVPAWL